MFSLLKIWLSATPLGFLTRIPVKFWVGLFAILIALGAFFWFKHSIYKECQLDAQAKADAKMVKALELELSEAKQQQAFLLANQRKNEDFIKRQKRALKDANEKDGDVSPLLRGGLDRLRNDRAD